MTWIADALAALRLPPKVIAGIALPAGILTVAPATWIQRLGLDGFMGVARPYVSLSFILALSLLLIEVALDVKNRAVNRLQRKKALLKLRERVSSLDPAERIVLREFVIQGQTTVKLPLDQPVVAGLMQKGIIVTIGQYGEHTMAGRTFPFRIRDEVLPLITHELLGLPEHPTEDDRRRVLAQRPPYMGTIAIHDKLLGPPW